MTDILSRRGVLSAAAATVAAAAASSAGASAATAGGPMRKLAMPEGQVPGVYRWKVGSIVLTAVADGYANIPLALVPKADPALAEALARDAFVPAGDLQCVINAYVVQTPTKLVVIDTGFGAAGDHTGKFRQNLEAAGVDPGEVDVLVITHGHPDHTSGMLKTDGSAAFPNAELLLHANEKAFWNDAGNASRAPDFQKPWFDMFQRSVAPYAGRTTLVEREGQEIVPGLRVRELFGHTPGHIGLHVADGGEQHLIWTDIIHFPHLQFPRPDWGVAFDADTALAAEVRKRVLDEAAADRVGVSGMHLVFPTFGHVRRAGPGAYAFEPARWRYEV